MLQVLFLAGWMGYACGQCTMLSREAMQHDFVERMCPPVMGPTGCGDGSAFEFVARRGTTNENKVLVDFMGGGACSDFKSCSSDAASNFMSVPLYTRILDGKSTADASSTATEVGIENIALSSPAVAGLDTWTYVFVPYCTQDIHLGTCERTYARPLGSEMIFALLVTMINFVFKMMDFVF